MNEKYIGDRVAERSVFDESFRQYSFTSDTSHHLLGIEIMLTVEGRKYLLTIETYDLHLERLSNVESTNDSPEETDTLVVNAAEILPSDLMAIKQIPFAQLQPFLLAQDKD